MGHIQGNAGEIRELARYEIRPDALEQCLAAIHEFVAYVRDNEAGALRYEVWQRPSVRRASCTPSSGGTRRPTGFTGNRLP